MSDSKDSNDSSKHARDHRVFKDGHELGLEPTESLDLGACDTFDLAGDGKDLLRGRQLGEAADVLEEMIRDEECLVVGTFAR